MDDWKIDLRKRYAAYGRIPAVNWVIDNWKPSAPTAACSACVRLDAPETIEPEEIAIVTVVAKIKSDDMSAMYSYHSKHLMISRASR